MVRWPGASGPLVGGEVCRGEFEWRLKVTCFAYVYLASIGTDLAGLSWKGIRYRFLEVLPKVKGASSTPRRNRRSSRSVRKAHQAPSILRLN